MEEETNLGSMVKKKRNKGSSSSSSSKRKPKLSSTSSSSKPKNPHPDLISVLPDFLLLRILTFLDTRKVVQTCLLSRRWRYLWKSVPCLTLWDTANFIDKCLFHHHQDSKVQKLLIILCYEKDKHALLVDSWLPFAIKCKVEDFELDLFNKNWFDGKIQYDQLYKLPHSFYLCTTLTSLTLCGCNLNLPDSFQLGSLKKLSLRTIELNPDSIEHLSSSCPSLEDIILTDCNSKSYLSIVITNGNVKRLGIVEHGLYGSWKVKLNAPTLLSLGIYDCHPTVMFHVENLASLMRVDVIAKEGLLSCCESEYYFEEESDMNIFEKLLFDLRHVKHLKLCGRCVQVLSLMKLMSSHILPISATCLELEASMKKWEFPGIRYLLENCSNLVKLKIVDETYGDEIMLTEDFIRNHALEEKEYWASFGTDLPLVMQNIKTIEVDLRDKSCHEEFVRFLLKNAKILETMVINTPKGYAKYNYEWLFKLSQRLRAFPRLHLLEDTEHVLVTVHFGVLSKL